MSLLEVGERDRGADAEQAGIDALDDELLQSRHLLDQAGLKAAGRDARIGNAPQVRNIGAVIAEAHLHARRHEEDGRQNELQTCGSFVSAFDEIRTNDLLARTHRPYGAGSANASAVGDLEAGLPPGRERDFVYRSRAARHEDALDRGALVLSACFGRNGSASDPGYDERFPALTNVHHASHLLAMRFQESGH